MVFKEDLKPESADAEKEGHHGPDGSGAGECQAGGVPGGRLAPLGQLPAVHARGKHLQPLVQQLRLALPLHTRTSKLTMCWVILTRCKLPSHCHIEHAQQPTTGTLSAIAAPAEPAGHSTQVNSIMGLSGWKAQQAGPTAKHESHVKRA